MRFAAEKVLVVIQPRSGRAVRRDHRPEFARNVISVLPQLLVCIEEARHPASVRMTEGLPRLNRLVPVFVDYADRSGSVRSGADGGVVGICAACNAPERIVFNRHARTRATREWVPFVDDTAFR